MAYLTLGARTHDAPPHRRLGWRRIAVLAANVALWAGLITLTTTLF